MNDDLDLDLDVADTGDDWDSLGKDLAATDTDTAVDTDYETPGSDLSLDQKQDLWRFADRIAEERKEAEVVATKDDQQLYAELSRQLQQVQQEVLSGPKQSDSAVMQPTPEAFRLQPLLERKAEILRQAAALEPKIARLNHGNPFPDLTDAQLSEALEQALVDRESAFEAFENGPSEQSNKPHTHRRLARERDQAIERVALLEKESEVRERIKARNEVASWVEQQAKDSRAAVAEIQEAQRQLDMTLAAIVGPPDPRQTLDIEDARKRLAKAYEKANAAQSSLPGFNRTYRMESELKSEQVTSAGSNRVGRAYPRGAGIP